MIHTHTRAGTAVSALADGLLPLSQTAIRFSAILLTTTTKGRRSTGVSASAWWRTLASECHDPAQSRAIGMRAHIPQAFNLIFWLEQACKIQIDILSCGRALHVPRTRWCGARPTPCGRRSR